MRFKIIILITIIVCKCKTSELTHYEKEAQQDNNETAQTVDKCTPNLSNLTINAISKGLNITWEGNTSEKCNFQYGIKIVDAHRNISSKKIDTTYYHFEDVKPCTRYNVMVELFQIGNPTALRNLSEFYETESIAFNQIEKLNISTTTSVIRLSWRAHKYAHVCNIRYIITANKEIPYFRYVNRTEHWIKNLHSCTEYKVSVTPSSRLRSELDDKAPHLIHLISTLPEKVNNLTLQVHNTSIITWIPPDNNECIKEYKIKIDRIAVENTTNTSLERNENLYCKEIEIEPVGKNNIPGAAVRIIKPGPVQNLTTRAAETSITVSWEAPENDTCVIDYLVEFVGTDKNETKNTTSLSYTFEGLTSCSKYEVRVAARSHDETPGEYTSSNISTSEPTNLGPVKNLNTTAKETSITVSWEPPENDGCVNDYLVELVGTDKNENTNTTSLSYTFEGLHSCSEYMIKVAARLPNETPGEYTSPTTTTPEPTKLGPVKNLHTTAGETYITASWEPPENGECVKDYLVELDTSNVVHKNVTLSLDYKFEGLTSCSKYEVKVAARSYNETAGEYNSSTITTSEPTKLGPVYNLKTIATETSITVSWEPPENPECVNDYLVELVGADKNETTTSLNYTTFEGLKSCSEYVIKVAARSSNGTLGEYVETNNSTFEPKLIGSVEEIIVNDDQLVLVTWKPPKNAEACNITYKLNVYDNEKEIYSNSSTKPSHVIGYDAWIGCMNYIISITPTLSSSEGDPTEEPIQFSRATNPPICKEKEVHKTRVILECNLDDFETNMCIINKIFMNCEAPVDKNNGSWIIWNATASQDIEDDLNRHSVNVTVENISEFTNYTCYGVVRNSAGNSSKSEEVTFQTQEEVPDAPHLHEVRPTNKTLLIKWEKPGKIPGIQQNYSLIIKSLGPQYFIPNDETCASRKESYNYTLEPSDDYYYFPEAFPSYKYEVNISASTQAGYGPPNTTNVETFPGIPEEPRDINFTINNNYNTTMTHYDANVTLSWMFPCYTNGDIEKFEVDVLGIPYADLDKNNHTINNPVDLNDELENLDYKHTIVGLKPAFNYTVYIKTVLKTNLTSNQPPFTFRSPESYPKSPVIKPVTDIKNDAFTLEWDEPPEKNGIILSYDLVVKTENSLYWVPPGCPIKNETYQFRRPPNEYYYTFKNATPYHKYHASINASTSVGNGSATETSTETLPAEPEGVRNFTANTTNSTAEEYNAQIFISFMHPCNVYGSFKQFTITLLGNRYNLTHNNSTKEIKETETYNVTFNLRAEYEYVVMVQVETETHNATTKMKEFTSSSGVPPNVTIDIKPPVLHDTIQAKFTFDCDLFDEQYGTIQYYAIILGEKNYEEASGFGFWDGTNQTWPSVNKTATRELHIQPYQATPNFWNPFKDCNCCTYTFVLGDVSISEFNKPLQDGITYTLKVRGITQHSFRDSPTIIFIIPAVTHLALILGLLFGILGTGILLGFIFILWRKRKQWQMKKESIKSIPLTPIPVSIKQFSQYYNELRGNSDKLKQEFTILTNKSTELILPSYDGLLPENKKKNRYTNIIPYDETRVQLMDTNDNYSVTDYINASYIIGYSGTMEYIATQGPLEHTCMDFWKMVIQENSSLIVMVAQFVEQNKDKCYKYFPNNHENMELENGIAIRCCTELDFKSHIVRTLLIQKDLQQWTVTHLQFTEWPDFGCPTGTEVILEFCQIMREHAERNSDPIIIHCSAGVGRTGTLIAVDIVLQAISYKRDIDIFGTVLNLRRDRKNMVQTEKQYLYIHNCIKDAIENPPPTTQCDILKEPVYENLEDIKRSQSDNNIKESIF